MQTHANPNVVVPFFSAKYFGGNLEPYAKYLSL